MCDRAYPPQQQKHAMNSIRDNKTNEDFAVQEVVPVVMETVQNEVQQHGLEWVGILQARDGYTSQTITTSNIPYTPQHSIHHFQSLSLLTHHHQTCITTLIPPTPHTILSHTAPSSSNGYTPSTLLHQTSPQPCNTHTHQHPSNLLLHHDNITSTQYPYDLPTYYTPPTFTTHPNTHTHPPTLYTPSNTLHTLQHPTHPPTPYTPSNLLLHHIPPPMPQTYHLTPIPPPPTPSHTPSPPSHTRV